MPGSIAPSGIGPNPLTIIALVTRSGIPADTPLVSLEMEGVGTKLMSWLKEGTPKIGMKVKAVFNTERPTHTILDLAWVPA